MFVACQATLEPNHRLSLPPALRLLSMAVLSHVARYDSMRIKGHTARYERESAGLFHASFRYLLFSPVICEYLIFRPIRGQFPAHSIKCTNRIVQFVQFAMDRFE
jgi:hypothetical protein